MSQTFDPGKYMRLALEEMKKSIQEPREDKASPKVGAVLVSPDGEVFGTVRSGRKKAPKAHLIVSK